MLSFPGPFIVAVVHKKVVRLAPYSVWRDRDFMFCGAPGDDAIVMTLDVAGMALNVK
jgi:hypothetical protein